MMRSSAALNLAWEVLAKARLTLAGLAAALAGACVFATWRGAPPAAGANGTADLFVLAMVLSMLFLFGAFTHTHLDRRSGQSGFPNRLFTYPVSTRLLVTTPMLCGLVGVVALYLAWTHLVLHPLGRLLPVAWPALVLAAAMAWYQATLWSLAAFRVARLIALCLLGTTLITLAVLPAVDPARVRSGSLNAVMVVLIAAAYVLALVSVKRQRHAGGHGAGFRFVIERLGDAIPSRSKPFRSPAHAQFWLESQRAGMLLPAATLLVMLFVIFVATVAGEISAPVTLVTLIIIAATPFVLAYLVGSVMSLPIVTAPDSSISTFLATRPISCGDMIAAKVLAAAAASALAWAIVLVLTPLWLAVWSDASPFVTGWRHFSEAFPGNRRWLMAAMVLVTTWLTTWRMAIANLHAAVAGRPVQYIAHVLVGIAAVATGTSIVVTSIASLAKGEANVLDDGTIFIALLMFVALAAKVVVALVKGNAALVRGWMSERSAVVYLACWIGATALVATTFYLAAAGVEAALFPKVPWFKLLALLAGLLTLPIARLALASHVMAGNRHR